MSIVFIIFSLPYSINGHINMLPPNPGSTETAHCISEIMNRYLSEELRVTYVDMNSDENILQAIDKGINTTFLSRIPQGRHWKFNRNYLIHAKNIVTFTENFEYLTKEGQWNPRAKFFIILNDMSGHIQDVFDCLLKFHVLNVLIIDASGNNQLYTYEPFKNFGCGKRYDRIVSYGSCLQPNVDNLFPDKIGTGLRNCTLNIVASHWPPYVMNPSLEAVYGIEQYVFNVISRHENFNINYIYIDNGENYSEVMPDMTVSGSLKSLQDNTGDINIGGMLLMPSRAEAFDYLWSHFPLTDELVILVKRSTSVVSRKYLYLEFTLCVWILLLAAVVICTVLMIVVLKIEDKCIFVFNVFGSLLGRGLATKLPDTCLTKIVIIHWIWFAYLISIHYQSHLTSFTTKPLKDYQISKEEDLTTFNLKACVSPALRIALRSDIQLSTYKNYSHGCNKILESMTTVSETEDAFAITFSAIYRFYKYIYGDVDGGKIYVFKQPLNKVICATYFYKGFPMLENLNLRFLRMVETGLTQKALDIIDTSRELVNKVHTRKLKSIFVVPWLIMMFGITLASISFVVELVLGWYKKCVAKTFSYGPFVEA